MRVRVVDKMGVNLEQRTILDQVDRHEKDVDFLKNKVKLINKSIHRIKNKRKKENTANILWLVGTVLVCLIAMAGLVSYLDQKNVALYEKEIGRISERMDRYEDGLGRISESIEVLVESVEQRDVRDDKKVNK